MSSVYRLCSSRFLASSGLGASLYGGRWNKVGTEVVYAAGSPSLAALEVLVHYNVLPTDFVLTRIVVPDKLDILSLDEDKFPDKWDAEVPGSATQEIGERWVKEGLSAVLSVPSSVVRQERNFVINPAHSSFCKIEFLESVSFRFDPRLK